MAVRCVAWRVGSALGPGCARHATTISRLRNVKHQAAKLKKVASTRKGRQALWRKVLDLNREFDRVTSYATVAFSGTAVVGCELMQPSEGEYEWLDYDYLRLLEDAARMVRRCVCVSPCRPPPPLPTWPMA